ncbi:Iron-dependent repressor IdeR [bacterium HR15]|nr:Iron-dependent repressor IdeR [bacterium HR15]
MERKVGSRVSVEDYLKAILHLSEGGELVSTTALAQRLDCTPAAVTQMCKSLAQQGLVQHQPYRGVRLTEQGRAYAEEIVRHHRLLERYLCDHLGFSPEDAHAEAERLEHHISEEFEDRIAQLMNEPATCPHGQPIPPKRPVG